MLQVEHLSVRFPGSEALAVEDVSFSLNRGEILGLVGESGSGKSVTAQCLAGLLLPDAEVTGTICLEGQELTGASPAQLRAVRGKEVAMVFQEPMTSLNPVLRVERQVEEALRVHTRLNGRQRRDKALAAMAEAELPEPAALGRRYPHQLSGGQLQRAMIAAALVSEPKYLLCDEITTALDVTVQAQILDLLSRLSRERNMGVLFISHDLRLVKKLCHRALVMRGGRIVETGTVEELFRAPREAYTRRLLDAIPTRNSKLR